MSSPPTPPKGVFPHQLRELSVLGITHNLRLTRQDTGGALTLVDIAFTAGQGIPPHVHTREDECFHVLSGQVRFSLDENEVLATPGTTIWGPRDIPHGYVAVESAQMLVVIQPAGIETMFEELAAMTLGPQGQPDMGKLIQICDQYGIRFD